MDKSILTLLKSYYLMFHETRRGELIQLFASFVIDLIIWYESKLISSAEISFETKKIVKLLYETRQIDLEDFTKLNKQSHQLFNDLYYFFKSYDQEKELCGTNPESILFKACMIAKPYLIIDNILKGDYSVAWNAPDFKDNYRDDRLVPLLKKEYDSLIRKFKSNKNSMDHIQSFDRLVSVMISYLDYPEVEKRVIDGTYSDNEHICASCYKGLLKCGDPKYLEIVSRPSKVTTNAEYTVRLIKFKEGLDGLISHYYDEPKDWVKLLYLYAIAEFHDSKSLHILHEAYVTTDLESTEQALTLYKLNKRDIWTLINDYSIYDLEKVFGVNHPMALKMKEQLEEKIPNLDFQWDFLIELKKQP